MMEENISVSENCSEAAQTQWLRRAKLLQRISAIVFSAIPVLLLLFYLAPSATSLGMDGESIYGLFPDQTGLGSCAIGLIVLTCLAALFAVPLLLGEFNKYARPLTPPLLLYSTLMHTAILIAAATLTGRIVALDGGLGLLKVGAAPVLTIVFSGIAVLLGGLYAAIYFHPKTDTDALAPYLPLPVRPPRRCVYPRWLAYAALGVFGAFAIGMFLFPIASIMQMAGMKGESFYDLLAAGLPRVPVYTDCAIALVIFACFGVLATGLYVALFLGKKYSAMPVASALCAVCALAQIIISSVVISQIGADDGGTGLLKAGAAPVLVLVFSLLAFLCGVAAIVIPYALRKPADSSERTADMQKELEELKRRIDELQNR